MLAALKCGSPSIVPLLPPHAIPLFSPLCFWLCSFVKIRWANDIFELFLSAKDADEDEATANRQQQQPQQQQPQQPQQQQQPQQRPQSVEQHQFRRQLKKRNK